MWALRFWLLAAYSGLAHSNAVVPPLIEGKSISGTLTPGAEAAYRVTASGPVRVMLQQEDADFSLAVSHCDGAAERTVDAFEFGTEWCSCDGAAAGERVVRIRRRAGAGPACPYRLQVESLDAALARSRMRAEAASSDARRRKSEGSTDALRDAARLWEEAAGLWSGLGEASAVRRALLMRADVLTGSGEYTKARPLYIEALRLGRESGDRRTMAEALNNRGIGYWQQSSFAEAIADLRAAEEAWRKLPLQDGRGATWTNLGLVHWQIGEFAAAAQHFERALGVFRPLGNRRGEMLVLHNQALTAAMLGDYAKAARLFERAASGLQSAGDPRSAGRSLTNSAWVYIRMGQTARADSNVRRGVALLANGGDRRAQAEAENRLAEVCAATGKYLEGLEHGARALEGYRAVGDRLGEANAEANRGLLLRGAGDLGGAAAALGEALRSHHALGAPAVEAGVLHALASVRREQGDTVQALRLAEAAVDLSERVRGAVAAEDLRISFLASRYDYYSHLAGLLMRRAESEGDARSVERAWQVAERSRARALVEALRGVEADAAPAAERRRVLQRLHSQSVLLSRDSRGSAESRARVEATLAELDALEARLRQADSRYRDLFSPTPPDLDTVRRELLNGDTLLLHYLLGEDCSYLWLVGKDSLRWFRLPPRSVIEKSAREVAAAMEKKPGPAPEDERRMEASARALAAAVLDPAAPYLGASRLLIVPDGALQHVPFAALPIGRFRAAIEGHEIVLAPSAATLLALRRNARARRPAPKLLAILADPVFDSGDARVKTAAGGAPADGMQLARLPFSRREAMAVAALAPPGQASIRLDFDASREALAGGALADYRILHISTHGVTTRSADPRPALVFSRVRKNGATTPGMVFPDQIAALRLNADLVVLSACRTASGAAVRGEGIMSLTRSFFYAGATRVAATLWRVDDEATAELMSRFLGAFLRTPSGAAAAALRRAQLAVRSQARWRHPYFWAGVVLQGEP
jgi:CHAT domain-containing protein/tetratricopeptide (TPR) repeat protein